MAARLYQGAGGTLRFTTLTPLRARSKRRSIGRIDELQVDRLRAGPSAPHAPEQRGDKKDRPGTVVEYRRSPAAAVSVGQEGEAKEGRTRGGSRPGSMAGLPLMGM